MFQRIVGALERIQYQARSPLFRELTDFLQELIDKLKAKPKYNELPINEHQAIIARFLFENDFGPRLKAIIVKHLNLPMEKIVVVSTPYDNAAIAVINYGPPRVFLDARKKKTDKNVKKNPIDYWENYIETIHKNIDTVDGTLRAEIDQFWGCVMSITTGCFTLSRQSADTENYTGEEIAALILHELGHAVTYLESFSITVRKTMALKELIQNVSGSLTGETLETFRVLLEKEMNKLSDPDLKATAKTILAKLADRTYVKRNEAFAIYATSLMTLSFAGLYYDNDLLDTGLTVSHFERITDEFMSQHGASAAFVANFTKGYTALERQRSRKVQELMTNSTVLRYWVSAIDFMNGLGRLDLVGVVSPKYDVLLRRMQLVLQNTTENLKDVNLPSETRDELIATIRKGRALLDAYKNQNVVKARQWIWETVLRVARPGSVIEALQNGNLAADYQRLQETTKDLIQNPFAYHAARLQSLIEQNRS